MRAKKERDQIDPEGGGSISKKGKTLSFRPLRPMRGTVRKRLERRPCKHAPAESPASDQPPWSREIIGTIAVFAAFELAKPGGGRSPAPRQQAGTSRRVMWSSAGPTNHRRISDGAEVDFGGSVGWEPEMERRQ